MTEAHVAVSSSGRKGRGLMGTVRNQVSRPQREATEEQSIDPERTVNGPFLYDSNKVYFGSGFWKIYFLKVAKPQEKEV